MCFSKKKTKKQIENERLEAYIAGLIIISNNLTTQIQSLRDEVERLRKCRSNCSALAKKKLN